MRLTNAIADATLRAQLSAIVDTSDLADEQSDETLGDSATRKRAYRDARAGSRLARVALVRDNDVLRWVYEPPPSAVSRRRGRRDGSLHDDSTIVHGFQFLEVPPNEIRQKLNQLDGKINDHQGLWRCEYKVRTPTPNNPVPYTLTTSPVSNAKELGGRVLLLIHGTFSSSTMFFEELSAHPAGIELLKAAVKNYDSVLVFDHPTLWIPPWANALRLQNALSRYTGKVDVVCHSRGGLVFAWWMYVNQKHNVNAVLVGSPMEGTSLAAPAKLKDALDLLANLARAVGMAAGTAATVIPMLTAAAGIMKIVGGVLSVGARTPLIDAGVALVPGLAAQSRDSSNYELSLLLDNDWMTRTRFFAIKSNFEPPENTDPWWKFWTYFRGTTSKLAYWGAGKVFVGSNDLVVDSESMDTLGKIKIGTSFDFSSVRPVHHCAYFRQPETAVEIRKFLDF
jgi:pimeloyl-ACP methyl ester carboxylesterase